MIDRLTQSIELSDPEAVSKLLQGEKLKAESAWGVHLSLYPVAQRVMNPPYINPHWPKAYRIAREFLPYLDPADIPVLVRLEANEYARRQKQEPVPKPAGGVSSPDFEEIEAAIKAGEPQKVAALFAGFMEGKGGKELARRLLMTGSGYMNNSLGHSVSCTAFVLLEMIEREREDPWPALARLADYFCRGGFHTTPPLSKWERSDRDELLKASSGDGIVNLHHTITRYAIERIRHLLNGAEYAHMLGRWVEFMGDKTGAPFSVISSGKTPDYAGFAAVYKKREEEQVLPYLAGLISTREGRDTLGRYLTKGVCDLYDGNYDPHFITGLGSALWVVESYHDDPPLAMNALRQYVRYFFAGL